MYTLSVVNSFALTILLLTNRITQSWRFLWSTTPSDTLVCMTLTATSHMRLRARDQYTSSTLIGGKGGASPSLLPTTLEGPTEYVNA